MTPTMIFILFLVLTAISLLVLFCYGILYTFWISYDKLPRFIPFLCIFIIITSMVILVSFYKTKIYSSNECEVDLIVKLIPKEHYKEEKIYIEDNEEPHKELYHTTIFGTEEWKLIKYIPKNDDYESSKKSNTESD